MRPPYEIRQRWRLARKLRRANRQLSRVMWSRDTGYGMGRRFYGEQYEGMYSRVSEAMGVLEAEARILTGEDC